MSIADPKTYAVTKSKETDALREEIAGLQAQVQALLARSQGGGGVDAATLETILARVSQTTAAAVQQAAKRENEQHPGISAYSHPEGDVAKPRELKCRMFWVGYDIDVDTVTYEEVGLLNRAEPGVYTFLRPDGRPEQMTVTGERGPDGALQKLLFDFRVREGRETLPSMTTMLRQAFGLKTPEQEELDRLRAELATVRAAQTVAA